METITNQPNTVNYLPVRPPARLLYLLLPFFFILQIGNLLKVNK